MQKINPGIGDRFVSGEGWGVVIGRDRAVLFKGEGGRSGRTVEVGGIPGSAVFHEGGRNLAGIDYDLILAMDAVVAMLGNMESDKVTMKCKGTLVQLRRCPVCHYFVAEATDIVWKRQPKDQADDGEIESCTFCAGKVKDPNWTDLTIAVIRGSPVGITSGTGCFEINPPLSVRCKRKLQLGNACMEEGQLVKITKVSVGLGTVYAMPRQEAGIWLNVENFDILI